MKTCNSKSSKKLFNWFPNEMTMFVIFSKAEGNYETNKYVYLRTIEYWIVGIMLYLCLLCNMVFNCYVFIVYSLIGGSDYKLIYRHYATLYFVFCVDSSESELGILDLIQVFVETLDKCFENVCELDLIFHVDKVILFISNNNKKKCLDLFC